MATAESVKNDIQRLIDDINLNTGEHHTSLESGVASLIRHYLEGGNGNSSPGGSSGGEPSRLYVGSVTPSEKVQEIPVTHNLGTTDILLVAVWAEDLGNAVLDSSNTVAKFWARTGVPTLRGGNGYAPGYTWNSTGGYAGPSSPISAAYETLTITDANNVTMPRATSGSNTWYLAGVTYTVVVVAA